MTWAKDFACVCVCQNAHSAALSSVQTYRDQCGNTADMAVSSHTQDSRETSAEHSSTQ